MSASSTHSAEYPFDRGVRAFNSGDPKQQRNPYTPYTQAHADWTSGWRWAKSLAYSGAPRDDG